MEIKSIYDVAFQPYGRILTQEYEVSELLKELETKEAPEDDVIYIASDGAMESLSESEVLKNSLFGGMPIQIGYCNGTNNKLDALEYHRNSEVGISGTDLILLLGKQQNIKSDFTYDTSWVEAFYVPAGEVYELYATTLHYTPLSVNGKVFRNLVVLPKGTNTDVKIVESKTAEDKLLYAKNKWLISHKDSNIENSFIGLTNANIEL